MILWLQGWCCQLYQFIGPKGWYWYKAVYKHAIEAVVSCCERGEKCCRKTCFWKCLCFSSEVCSSLSCSKVDWRNCCFVYWWQEFSNVMCNSTEVLFICGLRCFEWISCSDSSSYIYFKVCIWFTLVNLWYFSSSNPYVLTICHEVGWSWPDNTLFPGLFCSV